VKLRKPLYSPYRDSYDADFMAAHADVYERRTRWTRMRLANVRELVDPHPGERVLDLGCAAGSITHFLSTFGCDVVGVDSAPTSIEAAHRLNPDLEFALADCSDLPFAAESFDKAVAADLTEHLDEETLVGMFRECLRVLRPGGTFSIHTPNPRHLVERLKERELLLAQNPTHTGLRTRDELEARLVESGFEVAWSVWRPSLLPLLRSLDRTLGAFTELFRYRICIRARKPSVRAG
jgi:SAM-dependent methyltransferase